MTNRFIPPPPGAYSYLNIVGPNTGQQVKTGPGSLGGISINNAASASTIALYDGTSAEGTPIASEIDGDTQTSLSYGVQFSTGLFVVITGSPDITIIFA